MAQRASFSPTGARAARPEEFLTGRGITFGEVLEIQRGTKREPRTRFGIPDYEGVNPQKSFSSRELGTLDTDKLLDKYADGSRINPFEVVGVPTGNAMTTWVEFIDDYDQAQYGARDALQQRYDPKTSNVNDNSQLRRGGDRSPAPQSVVPTSTTNPDRPRTLSAGFVIDDPRTQTGHITVMFRDGTMYNYYQVSVLIWNEFKASPSKGRYIRDNLDSFPRGFASGGNVAGRRTLHRAARTAQRHMTAKRGKAVVTSTSKNKQGRTVQKGRAVQVRRQTHR